MQKFTTTTETTAHLARLESEETLVEVTILARPEREGLLEDVASDATFSSFSSQQMPLLNLFFLSSKVGCNRIISCSPVR